MSSVKKLREALAVSLNNDPNYTVNRTYIGDVSEDADIKLPFTAIRLIDKINIQPHNVDETCDITNDDGQVIGRKYASEFTASFQLDIWAADSSSYDVDELGHELESQALYKHSPHGPARPFEDDHGNVLTDITDFEYEDGSREDDLTFDEQLRRYRTSVSFEAFHTFSTEEPTIDSVDLPEDGDFNDSDGDNVIENT